MIEDNVSYESISRAAKRLRNHIVKTPLLKSQYVN